MGNPMVMGAFGAAFLAFVLTLAVTIGAGGAKPGVPWFVYSAKQGGEESEMVMGFGGYTTMKPKEGDENKYSDEDEKATKGLGQAGYMCAEKGDEESHVKKADGTTEKGKVSDGWICKCKAAETPSVALWAVTAVMGAIATGAFGARAFSADSQALYGAGAACGALGFVFAMAATINYEVNCITPFKDQNIEYSENKKRESGDKAPEDSSGPGAGMILACIAIVFFAAATGVGAVAKPATGEAYSPKAAEPKKEEEEKKEEAPANNA
jgi:hypothetical protein